MKLKCNIREIASLKDKNDRNGNCIHHYSISNYKIYFDIETIEQDVQDTNAGKQLS